MLKRSLKQLIVVTAIGFIATLSSCSKEEGPGGTSTITGKIYVRDYNNDFSVLNREYFAQEQDVYLIYGSDAIYSDRFRTHYDGSYWFQYLREGTYTIYAYSKDSTFTEVSGVVPVKVSVTIGDNGKTVEAPLITILN